MRLFIFPLVLISSILLNSCKSESPSQNSKEVEATETEKPVVKDGPYIEYYATGELKVSGEIKKGQRSGIWAGWYKDGQLKSEQTYRRGKREGSYKLWYENGQTKLVGTYKADKEVGIWKYYTPEGKEEGTKDFSQ